MNTTGYFDAHPQLRPRIFAHRGFTFESGRQVVDENTLEAFQLALDQGADYLESDIQVTADGIPVLFHDRDLKRFTGKRTPISSLTLHELKSIKLPLQGTIPTLQEALELFLTAKFNLDIKTPLAEKAGIQVITDLNASNRVLVSSFSEASRKRALANSPSAIATSAGSSKVLASYIAARSSNESLLKKSLKGIDALQIPTSMYGIDFTHPKFLEKVLPLGIEIHYWTINDPKQMVDLYNIGAHGIVTDRTDLAVQAFS